MFTFGLLHLLITPFDQGLLSLHFSINQAIGLLQLLSPRTKQGSLSKFLLMLSFNFSEYLLAALIRS
ncbi:hypothetical protein ACQKFM_15225 [Paenibacillus xylanexedens]|uniref:hypothetical protein n=1 Tax=Paenibacillus xylanexedens TaxID=528191 RepID=UPI003D039801